MNPPTDWTSAIAIGIAGLILGALLIYFFTRRKSGPVIESDLDRKDLEAKRDALVAQLRALPDDAIDERSRLESETASVLRSLDKWGAAVSAASTGRPVPSSTMDPTVKGFLWGSASTAALAALLYFVMQAATPRPEGEMATGGFPTQQGQQSTAAPDPVIAQLEAAVKNNPNNTTARLDLAQLYLERDNMMGVFEQTKVVLEREPQNSRALTLAALVRMAMGEAESAVQMLQQATSVDPMNLDSRVALAWIYAQTNRVPEAEAAIADAVRVSPENKARLEEVLTQMKAHAAMPQQQAAQAPQTAPAAPAAAASGPGVTVNIALDPGAQSRSGVLFVIARNPQGGPPVAVKRVMASSFPMTVQLTSADSMLGQPLPASFRVEARLDSDGNATTKPPTDPSAFQDGVGPGAAVALSLK